MERIVFTRITGSILILAILVSGCASSTVLRTTPADADVYVQGQRLGKTPYAYSDRKIIGASTLVTFEKDGYEAYNTTIRKNKKLNVGALISGLFFIYPLFWVMGYDKAYAYDLDEVEVSTQPVAKAEPVKPEITSHNAVDDPEKPEQLPQSTRIEKLLAQGQVEKAVEYAEEQEGAFQSGCFYSIAHYYLDKGDYATAEDFFNRSGKTNDGNVRIAEALMRGEIVDSVMVIDEKKIKTYLEKVYDSDEEITGRMAACYEKYADESKKRGALAKSLKDMGMIAMSSGGKTIDINESLVLSKMQTLFYLNEAVRIYEDLGENDKTEVLKNEIEVLIEEFNGERRIEQNIPAENDATNLQAGRGGKNLPAESPEMKFTGEDNRIIITVDSIVRSDSQPQDLVTALKTTNSYIKARPGWNQNYVMVYFNKTEKIALNISGGQTLAPATLTDQSGKNYKIILERGPSAVRLPGGGHIMWNPKVPQPDGVIISYQYMIFFMPRSSTPVHLNYVYYYKIDIAAKKPLPVNLPIDLVP